MADDLLFHDLAALAARVEDEAGRCHTIGCDPGVDAVTARAAGLAYAKLDTLEEVMFEVTNSICYHAGPVGLDATVARKWENTKKACRETREQASVSAGRLVSEGACSG